MSACACTQQPQKPAGTDRRALFVDLGRPFCSTVPAAPHFSPGGDRARRVCESPAGVFVDCLAQTNGFLDRVYYTRTGVFSGNLTGFEGVCHARPKCSKSSGKLGYIRIYWGGHTLGPVLFSIGSNRFPTGQFVPTFPGIFDYWPVGLYNFYTSELHQRKAGFIMTQQKKPKKPHPDFPLFPHRSGQWCKKVRGKFRYFGVWADPVGALDKFKAERDDLYAGRDPRAKVATLQLGDLANEFLALKREQVDQGELTGRAWADYHAACDELVKRIGRETPIDSIRPEDFAKVKSAAAKRFGPATLSVFIQRIRTLFKYGFDVGTLAVPMRFGPGFGKPSRKTIELDRDKKGEKLIPAEALNAMIDGADVQFRAMLWLGINCGFGQTDCAELRYRALEARDGWVSNLRTKTAKRRRCPLWPETAQALADVAKMRPSPLDPADEDRVFLTPKGRPWVYFSDKGQDKRGARVDAVRSTFDGLRERLKIKTPGGFYALRHTFRTVADGVKDQPAAMLIMGHIDETISRHYRQSIADERLQAVVDHVRKWLLAGKPKLEKKNAKRVR